MTQYPQPDGFVKALFAGQIRQDLLLPYPRLDPQQVPAVERALAGLEKLAREKIDPRAIDRQERIPDEVKHGMAQLGLFGITIPQEYGGLGLGLAAYGRIIEAVTTVCPALMLMLGAHLSIGLKGVILYGHEQQKTRYLPKLASGEAIAAFALTEPQAGSDAQSIQSTAVRDGDGWRLNGSKIWISNGDVASMITVFARTPEVESDDPLTAFLVEPGFKGFSLGPYAMKMGLHGTNSVVLRFDDVYIPPENVLGQPGQGFSIAVHILNSGRLGLAASSVGAMKHALRLATKWALERKAFGFSISEYELIQRKIAQMAVDIFAAESMVQVATGLAERGMDYEVEAAMVKVFASEAMWNSMDELVQVAGGRGYVGPFPYERMLRDSRVERIFEGTNEILRLFIFEQGTKPLARYMRRAAMSARGMLDLAEHKLSHLGEPHWTGARPSAASRLSELAHIFRDASGHLHRDTEATLQRHGKALLQRQLLMTRLADMAIDAFGMAAALSHLESLTNDAEALSRALTLAEPYFYCAAARFERNREGLVHNNDPAWVKAARLAYERGDYPLS
jgi:acyl-CoA dehydrogenase family protein 9